MKTSGIVTRVTCLTASVMAFVGAAWAQPVSGTASSVEWAAANSDLIVRALIDDVSVHALKDGLHGDAGRHRYQMVTVRVLETLQGEHSDRLQFVQNGDFGAARLSDLHKNQQEVLLFLEHWSRSKKFNRSGGGYAYTRFPHLVDGVILFGPEDVRWAHSSVPVLSSDLTRLSTPKQTIETVTSYLKGRANQEPVRGVTIRLPPDLRGGYYEVAFTFPADADIDNGPFRDTALKRPILDYETFKKRCAKEPPAEKKSSYSRKGGGYIGVYALELMAADCDVIVRGVIEQSCFVSRTDDPTGDSYGIKMRVVETIRTPRQVTCVVSDAGELEKLQRDEQELIFFLRSNRNQAVSHPAGALEYRTRGLWDDSVIVLNEGAAEVLFADLTWHRHPHEILTRLRATADPTDKTDDGDASLAMRDPAGLPVFSVHPPATIAAESSIAGNRYAVVYLPVNQRLEENARKWAVSNNRDLRWVAARAMVYFKSDKNAAILRRMLDDDATWDRREMLHMTGLSHPHDPEFLVRWEAWHVLAGWGHDVPTPVFTTSRRTRS
jgi:hypothetical protein